MTITERVLTGVAGLDEILCGGLPKNRVYLFQGDPGVGKTTLALQFLLHGVSLGEKCLYVTLSESMTELKGVIASHGWSSAGLDIFEMSPVENAQSALDDENTLYMPSEVELGERIQVLLAEVDRVKPDRLVIDSCSELRLLANSPLRFRRQILLLKEDLVKRGCTIVLLENPTTANGDVLLQSLVHGVVSMEQMAPEYGAERRRLRVIKLREVKFRGGYHDFIIEKTGITVFPRLIAADHEDVFDAAEMASCGVAAFDQLLCGGPHFGTAMLILGPAGSGKSAISTQYAVTAAERGEKVSFFIFDEGEGTLFARADTVGQDLRGHHASGMVQVKQIDPAEMSPGEFSHHVQQSVQEHGARIVVIDSLNGYMHSMPEERFLVAQLHELLTYLRQRGVLTIIVVAQHGLVGSQSMEAPVDVSYLADTVVLTRYFEASGRVRKAVSVVKKRSGRHEDTIREFTLGAKGFVVGPPLEGFRGVLTGVPIQVQPDVPTLDAPAEAEGG